MRSFRLVRLALILPALGIVAPACAPEKRTITPTTTGSDLRNLPRGRMTPLPFPGSSLAQGSRRPAADGHGSPVDPAAVAASTTTATR